MLSPTDALERLRTGNRRFASEMRSHDPLVGRDRRAELLAGQAPFAIILGCSDSRVPAEIVFDQGLGDLFVIRVAGNIIAPSLVGSVEFAAEQFGTRLVVVLGHTNCGAVTATLDELERPSGSRSPNLRSIVDRIRPTVEELRHIDSWHDRPTLLHYAVRANIRASAAQLRHGSQILGNISLRTKGCSSSVQSIRWRRASPISLTKTDAARDRTTRTNLARFGRNQSQSRKSSMPGAPASISST